MPENPHISVSAGGTAGVVSGAAHGHDAHTMDPRQVMATRELFWQNVMREILTSLSMMCALRPAAEVSSPELAADSAEGVEDDGAAGEGAEADAALREAEQARTDQIVARMPGEIEAASFDAQLFDGRLAVMTVRGERVAIADVFPLFACGIDTPRERVLSLALECTVFQIRTPAGEVYTLPLHEMRCFHALTPELMRRLSQMARKRQERETGQKGVQQPFGFAAFTSISRETPPPLAEEDEEGEGGEKSR